jgi:hypothetical protein
MLIDEVIHDIQDYGYYYDTESNDYVNKSYMLHPRSIKIRSNTNFTSYLKRRDSLETIYETESEIEYYYDDDDDEDYYQENEKKTPFLTRFLLFNLPSFIIIGIIIVELCF